MCSLSSAAALKLALSLLLLSCSVVVTDARPSTTTAAQLRTNSGEGRTSAFLRQYTFASASPSSATGASQGRYREINPSFRHGDHAQTTGSAKRSKDEDDSPLVPKRVGLVVRL